MGASRGLRTAARRAVGPSAQYTRRRHLEVKLPRGDADTRDMRTRVLLIVVAIAMGSTVSGSAATTGAGSTHAPVPGLSRALVPVPTRAPVPGPTHALVASPTRALVPRAIDPTGTVDVTRALNAYLARVPDGSTVVFPAKSRYRIEGTLSLEHRRNLVIEGQGSTFFAKTNGLTRPAPGCARNSSACRYPNRTRAQWSFRNDTNIVVRGVNVIGSDRHPGPSGTYDPALEAQHAFSILGVSGIVLDHVSANNVWGDLVNVGGASKNVIVENSAFYGASRQGWSITSAQHVTFVNNSVASARRSLIDIEANSSSDRIAYITIRNNRLGWGRFCTLTNYGAAAVEHDFVIADNKAIGSAPIKICVRASRTARRSNYEISGNVGSIGAQMPNEPMVGIAYVDRVTVKGNIQHFSSQWPYRGSPQAPVTSTCSSVVVTANRFTPRPAGMPESVKKPC